MINIVWFKKDLRLEDNHPLLTASKDSKKTLLLYIFEPQMWENQDYSLRHFYFLKDSLVNLQNNLHKIGGTLTFKIGEAKQVFESIHRKFNIHSVYSHQETGNFWSYNRDLQISKWFKENNIKWKEHPQNCVIRGLKNRSKWGKHAKDFLFKSIPTAPSKLATIFEDSDDYMAAKLCVKNLTSFENIQTGGRTVGLQLLMSFLNNRSTNYAREMSSPVTAYESCSRLSTHLAFGTLSIREIFQKTKSLQASLSILDRKKSPNWSLSLNAFKSRLRWHCHFIQKLEMQPTIEFENLHSMTKQIHRPFNQELFDAWVNGYTGFPLVDACMRALKATGWLNFRMRAMIVSFSSHHLRLPWQKTAAYLAKCFTDYEPGIHYSQCQMQSGTTGINSIRIYNPTKQVLDQDPSGDFIKKWVLELRDFPSEFIHNPYEAPLFFTKYTRPIVNERESRKNAAAELYALKKQPPFKEVSKSILEKHTLQKA